MAGTETLNREQLDIFRKKAIAFLATIGPDGQPQVTPVWVDLEGDRIAFNTAEGRVKHRNMERDPRVTLAATDPDNDYAWVSVQGRVTMTLEGADEHIDHLSGKYIGKTPYPWRKGETRVKVYLEPERIIDSN